MARIAVYGASGRTGRLVVEQLAAAGAELVVAGRDEARLRAAAPAGAELALAPLDDPRALGRALAGCAAVVNCAGPFLTQGAPVLEAAIEARVAYADTAAEQAWVHRVFERYGPLAEERGVALVPAAGFDFLPGDLVCAVAAEGLGPLRSLDVGYAVDAFRMSGGSLRSAAAAVRRRPLTYAGGAWRFGLAPPARVTFPPPFGERLALPFPAGEVVTAPRHLAVERVRTRIAAGPLVLGAGRSRWAIVAEAEAVDGRAARAAVQGEDVYATTAACAAHAGTLLAEGAGAGALAPAQAFAPEAFLTAVGLARSAT